MSGGGSAPSQPSNTTTTQTKEIPAWAQPTAQNLLTRGEALSNTPYQQYGGQRIADMTAQQQAGLGMTQDIALNGTPGTNAAQQNYADTMSGSYMSPDSNPYLKGTVNQALNDVQTRVNSQFNNSNYGTTAHQETLQRGLSQAANDAYGQNYQAERANQMKGQLIAPQMQNMAYSNAQNMVGVGDIYRQENQDRLNMQYGDWAAQQNQTYRQLDVLANSLGAAVNGQGNVQSAGYANNPYTTNRYANAIGGGLAGGALGGMLDSSYMPYGAAVGGLLGAFG